MRYITCDLYDTVYCVFESSSLVITAHIPIFSDMQSRYFTCTPIVSLKNAVEDMYHIERYHYLQLHFEYRLDDISVFASA